MDYLLFFVYFYSSYFINPHLSLLFILLQVQCYSYMEQIYSKRIQFF